MHLYLGQNPRTLFLVTSSQEEKQGRPGKALVFRAAERDLLNPTNAPQQAVVEFLPKDEVNLTNVVRLTSRIVKGCMGLISIDNGAQSLHPTIIYPLMFHNRHIPGCGHLRNRSGQHTPKCIRIRSKDSRSILLLPHLIHMGRPRFHG